MQSLEWTFVDKSEWPEGPWKEEPDKIQWKDAASGLPCLMVRNRSVGHWCGYVAVEEGHPAFQSGYDDVEVRVHGGLTFAAFCQDDKEHGICHIPEPGESDRVWWLGFDCAHAWDLSPNMPLFARIGRDEDTYRNVEYVREQCRQLAAQLAAMQR